MNASSPDLALRPVPAPPRFLLEDYLDLLRTAVLGAWLLLAALVGIEAVFRLSPALEWPTVAGFSLFYNALVGVFALNTLVLTLLLVRRDWYERIPRQAEHRVGWLLALVMLWLGLHLFFLFYLSGGFSGPLLALLPVLLIAAVLMPGRLGWWLAGYVMLGCLAVMFLAERALIPPRSPLAAGFSLHDPAAPLGWISLAAVAAGALAVAARVRSWMYPDGRPDHPAQRIDPDCGLFRPPALLARLRLELRRGVRQRSACSLLLIKLPADNVADAAAYGREMSAISRLGSDMPARLQPGCLAILLPAADGAGVRAYCERLLAACGEARLPPPGIAAVVVSAAGGTEAEQVIERAQAALAEADSAAGPHLVAL